MGLDQYSHREKFTHVMEDKTETATTVDGHVIPWTNLGYGTMRTTDDLIGYLRKANAVHGWIVKNLADGKDECQRIHLAEEDLIHLAADVTNALTTGEGMDPKQGFFFGSQNKDEYWRDDLVRTRKIVTWILEDMRHSENVTYYYQASW